MRPGQVDVEEEEQDAEPEDRWVELVIVSRQPIEEKMPIDLSLVVSSKDPLPARSRDKSLASH